MKTRKVRIPKHRCTVDGYGFVEWKGHRYYLPGKYGSPESAAAYKQFVHAITGPEPEPMAVPGHRYTVAEVARVYAKLSLTWVDRSGKPAAERYHVARMLAFLLEDHAHVPMDEFGPLALVAVRDKLIAAHKVRTIRRIDNGKPKIDRRTTEKTLTRRYINEQIARVRRFFSWAVTRQYIPASVADALSHVPHLRKLDRTLNGREVREGRKIQPAPADAVAAVVAKASPVVAAMIEVQDMTGMRPDEVCNMRPCDIDRSGPVWEYRPSAHKTDESGLERVVFLGARAQQILAPFMNRNAHAYLFSPREAVAWHNEQRWKNSKKAKAKPRKSPRELGLKYTPDSYRRAIIHARKRAAVPHWFPYQLRHARGTRVRKSHGLEAAQVVLGHSRADVTQVYAMRDLELARRVAAETG